MSMVKQLMLLLGIFILLSACSDQTSSQLTDHVVTKQAEDIVVLASNPGRYTKGLALYQQTCASCHGRQGEGAVNWQKRDAQGKYKPPPLNGTGHTWHHPKKVLMDIVRNGTMRLGGNMPPWKDKLSDTQIEDVLYWVQSQWPKEIYNAWYRNNEEVLKNQSMK